MAAVAFHVSQREIMAAVINFDDAADGTIIDTRYPGITFSNPIGGNIFARASSGAPSSPNVASVFGTGVPVFDARFGAVDGILAAPAAIVSVDVRPVAPPEFADTLSRRPFLQAFDAANNLLATVYYAGALPTTGGGVGPVEALSFTSTGNNIARLRVSSQNPGNPPTFPPTYVLVDNVRFDRIFSLAASATSGGSIRYSPEQNQFIEGALVTLSARPQAGWNFSHWSGDASGTDNPRKSR